MGISVDCSSTKTIPMVSLIFLFYVVQYGWIVRNTPTRQVPSWKCLTIIQHLLPPISVSNKCIVAVAICSSAPLPRYTELSSRLCKSNRASFFASTSLNGWLSHSLMLRFDIVAVSPICDNAISLPTSAPTASRLKPFAFPLFRWIEAFLRVGSR